ncbi:MAG TPA: PHP domain-containing protein, partial [Patescibacteria group bacterium]
FIPPELREDNGEIEAAQKHNLPKLVELKDIKGDLHLHSSFDIQTSHDLGANSIKEIAQKALDLGYEYIGISDHNPAFQTHSPKQMVELIKYRNQEIDRVNKLLINKLRVLKLLEIDIQPEGTLSVPNDVLDELDGALVSIHSSFRQSKDLMTKRILRGLEHPKAIILSHPTARLLKEREGIEADWEKIFEFCKKNKKTMEINAYPTRLDLTDTLVKDAVKIGVKMIIDTDAHANDQMDNMFYGVAVARRGWATKSDIINTLSTVDFLKYIGVRY